MGRLHLLCCAATASARAGGFAHPDEPLDAGGRRKAAACASSARPPGRMPPRILTAPAAAARETAALLGLTATVEPRLADLAYGRWTGHGFAGVLAAEPAAFAAWLAAPEAGTPGGEDFAALLARVAAWLREQESEPALAIVQPMVARAVLSAALGLPVAAALRIDLAPLARIRLSFSRGWRLQALSPP